MNKKFHNFLVGVSVLPALLVMPAMAETYTERQVNMSTVNGDTFDGIENTEEGAALYNTIASNIQNATFQNNSTSGDGGAIQINANNLLTTITDSTFTGNTAGRGKAVNTDPDSGAISIVKGIVQIDNTTFSGNTAHVAGAIYAYLGKANDGDYTKVVISDSTFEGNTAVGNKDSDSGAGAIANMAVSYRNNGDAGMWISNSVFRNNESTVNNVNGGGAIGLGSESRTNISQGTRFVENTSASSGGAIGMRNFNLGMNAFGILDISNATFEGNEAVTNGGAIDNYFYDSDTRDGSVYIAGTDFLTNSALKGGAVYNHVSKAGDANQGQVGNIYFVNSTFSGNNATTAGGAIYNEGTLTVDNATFGGRDLSLGNTSAEGGAIYNRGDATISGTVFQNNSVTGDGGALYISASEQGKRTIISDSQFISNKALGYAKADSGAITVKNGSVHIVDSTFAGNEAMVGGALYAYKGTADNAVKVEIENSVFDGNKANGTNVTTSGAGAIANFAVHVNNNDTSGMWIKNSTFRNNENTQSENPTGGGVLHAGSESRTNITGNTIFENNESASVAGAIGTRRFKEGANTTAVMDIIGATFRGNIAAQNAGAIDNYFYGSDTIDGSVYIANTKFEANKVTAGNGGAIYNHVGQDGDTLVNGNQQIGSIYFDNATFTGNIASGQGGAIYNEGVVTLAGTNTFTGNTANGLANDIHNVGSLTVASGTTTMDGGITGDGTLSIANGATLNIGTASITQDTINLSGTLIATVRSGDAQLNATDAFSGDGTLSLVFNDAGTYHVFGDKILANAKNQVRSAIYDLAWANNDKDVTATLKSAATIAQENNLSENSAAAILGMSQSSSEKLNEVAEKIQEKLAEATPTAQQEVEHAAKAVHPENESVKQSVATSVQTTVTNLASARMAAPMVGRNGGDVNFTSGGVWAQGLFNKSKQNDAFNGYTRGIAAGLDGTIDKVWTVGAGYSFAHSDITSVRDTEIDSNTVFLYGQYKPAEWYVNAVANYTWSDYSETADVLGIAKTADYDVNSFGGVIATGYNFATGITPELGLRYMHVYSDDYKDSFGTKIKSEDTDFLTAVLGAKYAFNVVADRYTTFIPQLNVAVKYDMLSDKNVATVAMPGVDAYTLRGERLNRLGGEFGIGFGIKYRTMDFSINYDIDVRKDYTSQTGMLKFRYNF